MSADTHDIPLFPLNTVLFPGGLLPLRIFETRYLDMVGECLRRGEGFGVCAIRAGDEVGRAAQCHAVGTLATIEDFDRGEDGLLRIVARGQRRFRIESCRVERRQLQRAQVRWLDDRDAPLPEARRPLADLLRQVLRQAGEPYSALEPDPDSAAWVAARLAELLPLALADKQRLLEIDDGAERLEVLYRELLAEEVSR